MLRSNKRLDPCLDSRHVAQPGESLGQLYRRAFLEGVTVDAPPADIGYDDLPAVASDSFFVDPLGNVRSDPMELREAGFAEFLQSSKPSKPSILDSVLDSVSLETPALSSTSSVDSVE